MVGAILGPRCDLVGVVGQGKTASTAVRNLQPDAVILDISLPDISGMRVLPELRANFPNLAIVIFTTKIEFAYRQEALLRGADEFVSKFEATRELLPAIDRALKAMRASSPKRAQSPVGR